MNSNIMMLVLGMYFCLSTALLGQEHNHHHVQTTEQDHMDINEQPVTPPVIGLNTTLTAGMMEPNQNLKKLELLIDAKSSGLIADKSLNFGFSMIALADYQQSNTADKFAYLMRHPGSGNQLGKTVSEAVVHSAQLAIVGSVNDWITAYGELLYSPQQSFGPGTITDLGRNQIDMRKAFLTIGNLNKIPVYLAIGKMDVLFGQTGSVSPFTNSTMWHAFGGLSYGATLGFKKSGLSASLTALQGGAQFRAVNSPIDSSNVPSRLSNMAADIHYTAQINESSTVRIGASYLKGSAYNQSYPIAHFNPGTEDNPAYAVYGRLALKQLILKGSFVQTLQVWPGTFNPNPPLNEFAASKVSSIDIGASYQLNSGDDITYILSAEFSNFKAGPKGSPWERQNQLVFGLNAQVQKTSRIFAEVIRTEGYAPLNFLTGGNQADPGATHSDRDARSTAVVLGILFSI